jgi:hypothetical protein
VTSQEGFTSIKLVCLLLHLNTDCVQEKCSANFMMPNSSKISVTNFTRKTNGPKYQYRLGNFLILQTDYIKGLGVNNDCKHTKLSPR